MKMHQLIIGNKNYSSWSLRPWLLLKVFNLPFEEIKIPLYQQQSQQNILQLPAMQEWIAAGIVEEEYLAGSEIDGLA